MISRRELLAAGAALAGASLVRAASPLANLEASEQLINLRFVHLTDLHIQPELGAFDGVKQCVAKVLSLKKRPSFILIGGDAVMDVCATDATRAELQFKLLAEALKPLEMPIYWTVGNHDVYGWDAKSPIDATDPKYGKKLWEEKVKQDRSYSSFEVAGRKFIILDSIQSRGGRAWGAEIDDEQLNWLKKELDANPTQPTVIVTHVPLFTIFNQYAMGSTLPSSDRLVVRNSKEVFQCFKPNQVKLVLQGHTHVVEDCTYLGTHFMTGGAVSGDWWKGPRLGVHPEGFTVVDFAGEKVSTEYVPYGWKARS